MYQPSISPTKTKRDQEYEIRAAYSFAESFAKRGVSYAALVGEQESRGIATDVAEIVAERLVSERVKMQREVAVNAILAGAGICVIGLVVTLFSYKLAAAPGGGSSYIIATGAIAGGGFRCLQGIYLLITNR